VKRPARSVKLGVPCDSNDVTWIAALAGVVGIVAGIPLGSVLSRRIPNPRARVAIRIVAVGVAVVFAECCAIAAVRMGAGERLGLSPPDRARPDVILSRDYRGEYKELVSHPKFAEATRGKSPGEIKALAGALTSKGLQYLDLPDLQEWARVKLRLAERSPKLCAGMWKGRVDDPGLGARTLTELAEPDQRAWARLSARASLRALDGAPPPGLDDGARLLALQEMIARLPEKDRSAATADMAKHEELSDERSCELMRMVLEGSRALPPQIQLGFLRSLAHQ